MSLSTQGRELSSEVAIPGDAYQQRSVDATASIPFSLPADCGDWRVVIDRGRRSWPDQTGFLPSLLRGHRRPAVALTELGSGRNP